MRPRTANIDKDLLKSVQSTAQQSAADGGRLPAKDDQPLVFKYSESKATGVWLNKTRMLGFSRLGATVANYMGGQKMHSPWRKASAIMGLISNISYFIWGQSNEGRVRELEIAHGAWTHQGDRVVQEMEGKLSDAGKLQLESIFTAAELSGGAVKIDFDSSSKKTLLSVKQEHFGRLQESMHALVNNRVEAIERIQDETSLLRDESGKNIQAISLDHLPEPTINAMKRIIETEWNIPVSIANQANGRWMQIPAAHQDQFIDRRTPALGRLANHIGVRALQEQPGNFWESLINPGKFPIQFGTNVGGILSNVFRIVATASEAGELLKDKKTGGVKMSVPQTKDMFGTVLSQLAYIIESQRELNTTVAAPHVIQGLDSKDKDGFAGSLKRAADNPMVSSMPFKFATLYMRTTYVQDLYKNKAEGAKEMMVATFFDYLTTAISAFTRKTDYGR